MTIISLGVLLDRACEEIAARGSALDHGSRLIVHPLVYQCVAQTRPKEMAQGCPLLLLGLELAPSEDVSLSDFKIVR